MMRDLRYMAHDALHYVAAAIAWRLPISLMMNRKWLGDLLLPLLGDYAFWDDPWCVACRWGRRGYDVDHIVADWCGEYEANPHEGEKM